MHANDILSGMQSIYLLGIENLVLPNAFFYIKQNTYLKENFLSFWPISSRRPVSSVFIFQKPLPESLGSQHAHAKTFGHLGIPLLRLAITLLTVVGFIYLTTTLMGLERWLCSSELTLLLQGIQVQYLAPTSSNSQPPVALAPGYLLNTLFWPLSYPN